MSGHGRKSNPPIRAGQVKVRLARTSEHARWDRLMRQHHHLGFKRFAGRGLRYIVEYEDRWVCLSGWQTGAFKSAARERWIGWQPVGESAGYSRHAGQYTEAHGEIKRMLLRPLRREARRLLCRAGELPSRWQKKHKTSGHSLSESRSLHEGLSRMRDFRRG